MPCCIQGICACKGHDQGCEGIHDPAPGPYLCSCQGNTCRRYSVMMGPSSMWGRSPAEPFLQPVILVGSPASPTMQGGHSAWTSASFMDPKSICPCGAAPCPGLNCQSSENVVGALNPSCQEGRVDSGPSARIDAEIPSSRQKA